MTQSTEIGPDTVFEDPTWRIGVENAAKDFAAALSETPELKAFERAYVRFRDDERAQEAMWKQVITAGQFIRRGATSGPASSPCAPTAGGGCSPW
jgi:hypothetical protein